MRRVVASCVLLEIALREAIDYGLSMSYQAQINDGIHAARVLRREIRRAA